MKSARHQAILDLITQHPIDRQEELIAHLREEGYEVVLINSNPATIMTDTDIADKVYMEPLNLEYVARIIRHERPDAILPSLGGQTGLNLAVQLAHPARWHIPPAGLR